MSPMFGASLFTELKHDWMIRSKIRLKIRDSTGRTYIKASLKRQRTDAQQKLSRGDHRSKINLRILFLETFL